MVVARHPGEGPRAGPAHLHDAIRRHVYPHVGALAGLRQRALSPNRITGRILLEDAAIEGRRWASLLLRAHQGASHRKHQEEVAGDAECHAMQILRCADSWAQAL